MPLAQLSSAHKLLCAEHKPPQSEIAPIAKSLPLRAKIVFNAEPATASAAYAPSDPHAKSDPALRPKRAATLLFGLQGLVSEKGREYSRLLHAPAPLPVFLVNTAPSSPVKQKFAARVFFARTAIDHRRCKIDSIAKRI
jgi:hypothetical protein